MLEELKQKSKVVGVKQTRRAVSDGSARRIFLARDADPKVTEPLADLCAQRGVLVEWVPSMKELGTVCGIAVGSAAAAATA